MTTKSLNRPFCHLQALVERKQLVLTPPAPERPTDPQPRLTPFEEDELFLRAMADVTPLSHDRHWQPIPGPRRFRSVRIVEEEEEEVVAALHCLIQTGQGFIVAQTGEYMEACRPGVDPRITRRLHQGRYSIQDHIDLHGLYVHEAEPILYRFILRSIQRGCHAVLVIHGRGLKSPQLPGLKAKVFEWLTRGPLRTHLIALASARACDGGAGATYVLLRRRPMGRRRRKIEAKSL